MIWEKRRGWIGVDLGSRAVKLVQVERREGTLNVLNALVIPRRSPWPDDGLMEREPFSSAEEIRAALSLPPGFRGRSAACLLPMSVTDTRTLTIPVGLEYDRREEVASQLAAEQESGLTAREFDFIASESSGDTATATENVTVVSLTQDWTTQLARDFSRAGLVLKVLDAVPMAMARAIQLAGPHYSRDPVVAIDWGYSRSTLCLVANGRPVFVRCLRDCGFSLLLERMAKQLGISLVEASTLLVEHGLGDRRLPVKEELQRVIEEVTAVAFLMFVEELNRTIAYVLSHRRLYSPTKVVLMGAGATIKNVTAFLSEKVEMPVLTWKPENVRLPIPSSSKVPLELFAPAIALSTLAWTLP